MATGVLPFVRGVDFTKNDFSVSLSEDVISFFHNINNKPTFANENYPSSRYHSLVHSMIDFISISIFRFKFELCLL